MTSRPREFSLLCTLVLLFSVAAARNHERLFRLAEAGQFSRLEQELAQRTDRDRGEQLLWAVTRAELGDLQAAGELLAELAGPPRDAVARAAAFNQLRIRFLAVRATLQQGNPAAVKRQGCLVELQQLHRSLIERLKAGADANIDGRALAAVSALLEELEPTAVSGQAAQTPATAIPSAAVPPSMAPVTAAAAAPSAPWPALTASDRQRIREQLEQSSERLRQQEFDRPIPKAAEGARPW